MCVYPVIYIAEDSDNGHVSTSNTGRDSWLGVTEKNGITDIGLPSLIHYGVTRADAADAQSTNRGHVVPYQAHGHVSHT